MKAVNLIPVEERVSSGLDAGRAGGTVYAVFGLIAGLAVLAVLYGIAAHQVSSRKGEVASLNARAAQAQARASALSPYTSFAAMRQQREQAVEQLVDSRFDWAQAFHELGRVLPTNVELTSLSGTIGSGSGSASALSSSPTTSPAAKAGAAKGASSSSSVSSATPPGSVPTFVLGGCTASQADVAIMLDRLHLIEGVNEVSLQASAKTSAGGGSGGSGVGGCPASDAVFTVNVTFDALPSVSGSTTSSTATVAATGASR